MDRPIRRFMSVLMAVLVLTLAGCAGSETQQSTGEYIDDKALEARVKTALLNDPQVSGLAVNVETFRGTVQLSGFVNNAEEKQRAAEIARSVDGVAEVRNNLVVK